MSSLPPPPPPFPPDTLPLRSERYRRPRRLVNGWALFFGVCIGLALGLFYAWQIAPVQEIDTLPRQLRPQDKAHYVVAVGLRFAYDSDLARAVESLIALELGTDPFQAVADIACDLARSGYVDSTAGVRGVRALKTFYQLQGKAGCADVLIPDVSSPQVVEVLVPTPTATLPPPPSKTPLPADVTPTAAGVFVVPTTPPQRTYSGRIVSTFCDVNLSGIIEVFVQQVGGQGVAGQTVRVRWDGGESRFVTGLKPERGAAYADFQMEAGRAYTIDMPAQADPLPNPIEARPCTTESGATAVTSYRVVFTR